MMPDSLYQKLNALREEYRRRMNSAASKAEYHAATGEMDEVSIHSTESERYREAFTALNRAIEIVEADAGGVLEDAVRDVSNCLAEDRF